MSLITPYICLSACKAHLLKNSTAFWEGNTSAALCRIFADVRPQACFDVETFIVRKLIGICWSFILEMIFRCSNRNRMENRWIEPPLQVSCAMHHSLFCWWIYEIGKPKAAAYTVVLDISWSSLKVEWYAHTLLFERSIGWALSPVNVDPNSAFVLWVCKYTNSQKTIVFHIYSLLFINYWHAAKKKSN